MKNNLGQAYGQGECRWAWIARLMLVPGCPVINLTRRWQRKQPCVWHNIVDRTWETSYLMYLAPLRVLLRGREARGLAQACTGSWWSE